MCPWLRPFWKQKYETLKFTLQFIDLLWYSHTVCVTLINSQVLCPFSLLFAFGNPSSWLSPFTAPSLAPDTNSSSCKSKQVIVPQWPLKIFMHAPLYIFQHLQRTDRKVNTVINLIDGLLILLIISSLAGPAFLPYTASTYIQSHSTKALEDLEWPSGLVLNFYQYTLFFYLRTAWKRAARFHLWHGYLQLTLKCRTLSAKLFVYWLSQDDFCWLYLENASTGLNKQTFWSGEEQGEQSQNWCKLFPFLLSAAFNKVVKLPCQSRTTCCLASHPSSWYSWFSDK